MSRQNLRQEKLSAIVQGARANKRSNSEGYDLALLGGRGENAVQQETIRALIADGKDDLTASVLATLQKMVAFLEAHPTKTLLPVYIARIVRYQHVVRMRARDRADGKTVEPFVADRSRYRANAKVWEKPPTSSRSQCSRTAWDARTISATARLKGVLMPSNDTRSSHFVVEEGFDERA